MRNIKTLEKGGTEMLFGRKKRPPEVRRMDGYTLIRSDRRTLEISVRNGPELVIRAPRRMPDAQIEDFMERRRDWIEAHMAARAERQKAERTVTAEEENILRERAKADLCARTEHFAAIMGVCPAGVKITSAKSRWGSCSPKNSVCYSWRLMLEPPEAIDYVVVHELAHIRYKNHGGEFHRFVASVLPDWRERERLLR